jgi:hypothetical protein
MENLIGMVPSSQIELIVSDVSLVSLERYEGIVPLRPERLEVWPRERVFNSVRHEIDVGIPPDSIKKLVSISLFQMEYFQ